LPTDYVSKPKFLSKKINLLYKLFSKKIVTLHKIKIMNDLFIIKYNDIINICEKYKVEKLYVFGSYVSGNYNKNSDIDLIVILQDINPVEKGENLLELWTEFENLFNKKVDLLTDQKINNPILFNSIERNKTLIYDRKNQKILV